MQIIREGKKNTVVEWGGEGEGEGEKGEASADLSCEWS